MSAEGYSLSLPMFNLSWVQIFFPQQYILKHPSLNTREQNYNQDYGFNLYVFRQQTLGMWAECWQADLPLGSCQHHNTSLPCPGASATGCMTKTLNSLLIEEKAVVAYPRRQLIGTEENSDKPSLHLFHTTAPTECERAPARQHGMVTASRR
jgi:hypothetical protein